MSTGGYLLLLLLAAIITLAELRLWVGHFCVAPGARVGSPDRVRLQRPPPFALGAGIVGAHQRRQPSARRRDE
jgi:hypothetical protein